jgi:competence protein ComEC
VNPTCVNYDDCGNDATRLVFCGVCGQKHWLCDFCVRSSKCTKRKVADSHLGKEDDPELQPKFIKKASPSRAKSNTLSKPRTQTLTLLHLDVDQGACTLVLYTKANGDKWTAVIDGGHGNPGRGQIARYLLSLHRKNIDMLFLSHHDADHTDGLADLIYYHKEMGFTIGELAVPYENSSHAITKYARANRVKMAPASFGVCYLDDDPICPFTIKRLMGGLGTDENGKSMVLVITLGDFRYLTCGDLPTWQGEDDVAKSALPIDAIFCSHHGSAHSTSENMLKLLDPAMAVISAGRNGYGHPNSETIERFPRDLNKFRLYLTGCQFNRKYINAKYYETEAVNLMATLLETWKQFAMVQNETNFKNLSAALVDGLLFCIEEEYEKEKSESIKGTLTGNLQSVLNGTLDFRKEATKVEYQKLCEGVGLYVTDCAEKKKKDFPIIGFLSGTETRMGPVGIRVPPPTQDCFIDVGFCDSGGDWKWRHRWKREAKRLVFDQAIDIEELAIHEAIPDQTKEIMGSPKKFSQWQTVRKGERRPFSLSTRTPRQPALAVLYKCRYCQTSRGQWGPRGTNMVLVACESCNHNGWIVGYHQECLLWLVKEPDKEQDEALKQKQGYRPSHPLGKLIEDLIDEREAESDVVMIPAKFEACFFCATFGNRQSNMRDDPPSEGVVEAINLHRHEARDEVLGSDLKDFDHDATFKEFYDKQPQFK